MNTEAYLEGYFSKVAGDEDKGFIYNFIKGLAGNTAEESLIRQKDKGRKIALTTALALAGAGTGGYLGNKIAPGWKGITSGGIAGGIAGGYGGSTLADNLGPSMTNDDATKNLLGI